MRYNPGPEYCVRGEVFEDQTNGNRDFMCWDKANKRWTAQCQPACKETDGMSNVITTGLTTYAPGSPTSR